MSTPRVSLETQRAGESVADLPHPSERPVSDLTHPHVTSSGTSTYPERSGRGLESLRSAAPPKRDPPYSRRGTQARKLLPRMALRYFRARPFAPEIVAPRGSGSVGKNHATSPGKASGTLCATRAGAINHTGHPQKPPYRIARFCPTLGHFARRCKLLPRCVLDA